MLRNLSKVVPALGFVALVSVPEFSAPAQPVTNAAGIWNYLGFSTPAWLAPQYNLAGAVVEIEGRNSFEGRSGTITVQPDGSFTGFTSGDLSWGDPGRMIVTLPGKTPIVLALNTAMDFAFVVKSSPGPTHDLELLIKAPATLTTNDLVGTWKMAALGTTAGLDLEKNSNGVVTDVSGRSDFGNHTGTMTMAGDGTFVMVGDETTTGFWQPLTNGLVQVTIPAAPDPPEIFSLSVNASKNVMAVVVPGIIPDVLQELDVLVKLPASTTPAQLQGLWLPGGFTTPEELILHHNGQGEVIGIDGCTDFEIYQLSACVGHTGGFTMPSTTVGQLTVVSPGTISVTQTNVLGETEARTIWVNAGHDVFIGTATSANPELLIATRTPPLANPAASMGLMLFPTATGPELYWASAPNRFLQTTTNFAGWATLTNSAGQGHRGVDPASFPQRFYRLLQTP
jgi:hypothetical protein